MPEDLHAWSGLPHLARVEVRLLRDGSMVVEEEPVVWTQALCIRYGKELGELVLDYKKREQEFQEWFEKLR